MDFNKKDFQQTIIGEAIRTAVDKVEVDLMAGTTKIEARKIVVEGLVASVEGGEIILNVGAKVGLKVGDRLTIERVTREVKDPVTNQVIRKISTQVGVIEITNVDDISSVAKIVSGNDFKIGDAAKTMTN